MMGSPAVDRYGESDYENAFDTCSRCRESLWAFDVGSDGLCEQCREGAVRDG